MNKTIYTQKHRLLCRLLRARRILADLKQEDVAEQLGVYQSFVSKYEKGERRLDVIEFLSVCEALDADPHSLIDELQARDGDDRADASGQ